MMNTDAGAHRCRNVVTVIGLALATVVVLAAPAFAHPVFPNNEPGFPNPMGGTGGPGQTPPYPAGSRPTLNMFLPFEQDGVVFNGAENTTVDVRVSLPTAWTNPACGPARTAAALGNEQLGDPVPGWSCAIETTSGHQVLHWSGPQVSAKQTDADSAQFFTFQATMPSPATTTSYGAQGGPEGIHVQQVYASGFTSLWTPPNDPPTGSATNNQNGHPLSGIANGIELFLAPRVKRLGRGSEMSVTIDDHVLAAVVSSANDIVPLLFSGSTKSSPRVMRRGVRPFRNAVSSRARMVARLGSIP